jgi:putative ABC transport system substrate-binding protein
MQRREFIAGVGGAAAWSALAKAQQGERAARVGVLMNAAESDPVGRARLEAFRKSLQDAGWIEGRNIHIEYRFAANDAGRTRTYARELVALEPEVIFAQAPVVKELKAATMPLRLSGPRQSCAGIERASRRTGDGSLDVLVVDHGSTKR